MIRNLVTNKSFMTGFCFIIILLVASIIWPIINDGKVKQITAVYKDGEIISVSPYPPSKEFFFGTDENGKDYFQMLVYGAKYTFAAVMGTAFLQMILAIFLGCLVGVLIPKWIDKIEPFFDSFNFLPIVVYAYFIFHTVLMPQDGFTSTLTQRIIFQISILALIGLPPLLFYIAKEVRKTFAKDYIEASWVLGAGRFYILIKHVVPNIWVNWLLLLLQQFTQILTVLMTLGVLYLYFGGAVAYFEAPLRSATNEWSSFLGGVFRWIHSHPWMVLSPIIFISCTVMSFKCMALGIESILKRNNKIIESKSDW